MSQNDHDEPVILPKDGELVAVDVMMNTLISTKLHLGAFFALKHQIMGDDEPHEV